MSEFIVREEAFKLGWVEKVPVPQEGECFLLYQSGAGAQSSFLINYGVKYSSAEIRHGHYNQKATLSLRQKVFSQDYRVIMKERDFCFIVMVKMLYNIRDVRTYFFEGKMEEGDIQNTVRKVIRQQDRGWNAWEDIELQNTLENDIEKHLKRYEGIRFRNLEVTVTPEEAAVKMRDSNKKKTVEIHVAKNEMDEQIAKNEQAERLVDSEQKLKMKQISDMALLCQNFGNMGPIVAEYLKGNMDGKELYDYIMRSRAEKLGVLQTVVSGDMLTQEETIEKLNEILSNSDFLQATEYKRLPGKEVNKIEESNTGNGGNNKKNEEEMTDEEDEKEILGNGDYL